MRPVGRRRTKNLHLPSGLTIKGGRYYVGRNQRFAGTDYPTALRALAELKAMKAGERPGTFGEMAAEYKRRVIPTKAARTQDDNAAELGMLLKVFKEAPLQAVRPEHIGGYIAGRYQQPRKGQKAPAVPKLATTRANREIALFSAIWNWGRGIGMTSLSNPCDGVKRNREAGRDRYVTDDEFAAVYKAACEPLRDALELYLLTGQRVADVLKMRLTDVRDGCLNVRQGKTQKPLRLVLEGELAAVMERIQGRKYKGVTSLALVRNEHGHAITYNALANRHEKARAATGVHFQLRDLRAKAATDTEDLALAQKLLGHSSRAMTERYTKDRIGERVRPLLRKAHD